MLEDHVLARQGVKRSQRPFSHELAEMVRYAVGYRSRAFVTFGTPMRVDGVDADSRRAVLDLPTAPPHNDEVRNAEGPGAEFEPVSPLDVPAFLRRQSEG